MADEESVLETEQTPVTEEAVEPSDAVPEEPVPDVKEEEEEKPQETTVEDVGSPQAITEDEQVVIDDGYALASQKEFPVEIEEEAVPPAETEQEASRSPVPVEGENVPEEGRPATAENEESSTVEVVVTEEPPTTTQNEEQAKAIKQSSADFTKGEGLEHPMIIQPISREPTPPPTTEGEMPQPDTPEMSGSLLDDDEEEILMVEDEEDLPQYNREELLQKYQTALQEREQLNQQNRAFQHKLSEYFRKKKTEEARQEVEKSSTDQEQRYMKYMSNLEELRRQQVTELESYHEQLEEMKEKRAEKNTKVEEEWEKAVEFKRAVALGAINSRSGRPIPPKDIEVYEMYEKKKESEVSQVRLENIKLKNRLKKQETQLKQKEELAEGLHLIDFEQLKIENQTYNEKIEERNEELLKLRKKITSTVQVLTHLKEKLQFVQAENAVKKEQLAEVEREVAQKRDILSRTKQARDSLRHENNKFQQKCGLLGNRDLLRDFEVSTDEADELEHRLDMLKRTHAELTLSLNGVKRKIELAKENQS